MGADLQPLAVLRGELDGRRLTMCGPQSEVRPQFDALAVTLRSGQECGWVSWSLEGQLVGHVTSPGYVRQIRESQPVVWRAEEEE